MAQYSTSPLRLGHGRWLPSFAAAGETLGEWGRQGAAHDVARLPRAPEMALSSQVIYARVACLLIAPAA